MILVIHHGIGIGRRRPRNAASSGPLGTEVRALVRPAVCLTSRSQDKAGQSPSLTEINAAAPSPSESPFKLTIARLLVTDQSFNRKLIGSVVAGVIIIVLAAYVLAQVVRTTSHEPTQNSTGTITNRQP